ncbi:hypothetical protein HMPREF1121_01139 [Porphyromonas sp. KLE 1280]|nr:hypothetical protein HMPREF1121_01139 [Porphyromonas sp. KLE 1280]
MPSAKVYRELRHRARSFSQHQWWEEARSYSGFILTLNSYSSRGLWVYPSHQ